MEYTEIDSKGARYVSEIHGFENGLPHGVLNKVKTDVGATYLAANCDCKYIIVCPFVDLIDSIAEDENNKYEVFKGYKGFKKFELNYYLEMNPDMRKIAVTYDSFEKLTKWLGSEILEYKVLIDEYHLILEDMDFRQAAIESLMNTVSRYNHYTFLSATPIDDTLEIEFLNKLPHYRIKWDNTIKLTPMRYKVPNVTGTLAKIIEQFLERGLSLQGVDGKQHNVRELYIFFNSVKSIRQVCDTLKLDPDLVKICCADKSYNRYLLNGYEIESVSTPNKTLNFFTKKCFQGCNLFTDNGLMIVVSDAKKTYTLVDVSTTMEQIAGRIRFNEKYQNIFRDRLIHLYSTNAILPSKEEFEEQMAEKEDDAHTLIDMSAKMTKKQLALLAKRLDLEADIVSMEEDGIKYNELKKQYLIYKQKLRESYMNGLHITDAYKKSSKFNVLKQHYWDSFEVALKRAKSVSYSTLLQEYIRTKDESFLEDYPEFEDLCKYITTGEMETLDYNKDKLL